MIKTQQIKLDSLHAAINDGNLFDNVELYDLIVQNVENKNLSEDLAHTIFLQL